MRNSVLCCFVTLTSGSEEEDNSKSLPDLMYAEQLDPEWLDVGLLESVN